jgi:hypothetical protein
MSPSSLPHLPNLSLVAFYGDKTNEFASLIQELQEGIIEIVGDRFKPYRLEQVHATLLGLEGRKDPQGVINKWFLDYRGETRYIDFPNFLNYLRYSGRLPIAVRIGGYNRALNYNFFSRDRHPYQRSFNLQKNIAVLIAWPCRGKNYPMDLDRLRLEGQNFNILHKYHNSIEEVDNDLYMRLGMFAEELTAEEIKRLEISMREFLEARSPLYLSIDANSVFFTYYQDEFLTLETTRVIPLLEASPEELEGIYPPRERCSQD